MVGLVGALLIPGDRSSRKSAGYFHGVGGNLRFGQKNFYLSPSAFSITFASSLEILLLNSEFDPDLKTIALSSSPVLSTVERKPPMFRI